MYLAEEDKLVHHLHFFVEAAFFGKVPDPGKVVALKWFAEKVDDAGVWHRDTDHHAYRGSLARAVRAEKAEHGARLDGEAQVSDGNLGVVHLADMLQFYNGHRFSKCEVKLSLSGENAS